jgi:hypothetical protein
VITRYWLHLFLTTALDGPLYASIKKTGFPLIRKLGGSQGRSGLKRNCPLPLHRFDPRIVRPVAQPLYKRLTRLPAASKNWRKCFTDKTERAESTGTRQLYNI